MYKMAIAIIFDLCSNVTSGQENSVENEFFMQSIICYSTSFSQEKKRKNIYCRSGNICEVLIFVRRTNLRIKESRKKYYYDSDALIEIDNSRILDFTKSP